MSLVRSVKGLVLTLGLVAGVAIPAEAGIFVGVGPLAVGVGRSRYLYGPPAYYGVPAYAAPAYYPPAYAPAYYGPSYYAPPYYGNSSEDYYAPVPTGFYRPSTYPMAPYPVDGYPTAPRPVPAAAYFPGYAYPAYPYRKVEIEYDRHGGYEVEFKR